MTTLTLEKTRIKTAFVREYLPYLQQWGQLLADESGLLVAISRKAPRLLELAVREGVLPQSLLHRVTSERALAFSERLVLETETAVLCDDIVIVGSTFQRYSSIATEIFGADRIRSFPF